MSILIFRGKVKLTSEDQMEAEENYDLGDIAKNKRWLWKRIAVPVEQVYKIISYDREKSIIQMFDDEKFLVKEPFDEIIKRWEILRKEAEEILFVPEGEESETDIDEE